MVCFQASCHNGLDPAGDIGNNIGCGPWPVPTCVPRELGNVFMLNLASHRLKAVGVAMVVFIAGRTLAARESVRQRDADASHEKPGLCALQWCHPRECGQGTNSIHDREGGGRS